MKTCSKCGETKSFADFHKRKSAKDGLKSACKICRNKDNSAYRYANPEKVKASFIKYKERNADLVKQRLKDWRAANLEKARKKSVLWYYENKDRAKVSHKINSHNRRARLRQTGGKLSPQLAKKLYALQKGKCACCKRLLGDKYHMDHIVPLARGGSNTDDNIQLLRPQCNQQKNAKHPVDFMQERGYLL